MAIGTFLDLPQKFGTAFSRYGGGGGDTGRLAPSFNSVSQYGNTGQRLVDVDNLDGFSFEIYIGDFSNGTIISQADSSSENAREFQVFILGDMEVNIGGVRSDILQSSQFPASGANLKLSFNASSVDVFIDGSLVNTSVYTVGPARQPTVNTWVFARGDGAGGVGFVKGGLAYNFKVNDGSVYNYPMDDGWANNPKMRNTGTGADGTFINMTEAAWVKINV